MGFEEIRLGVPSYFLGLLFVYKECSIVPCLYHLLSSVILNPTISAQWHSVRSEGTSQALTVSLLNGGDKFSL